MQTSSHNSFTYDFSLLVPCYNNTEGLKASIASINYPPDKYCILIIDDGSAVPIRLADILCLFPEAPEIILLRNEPNRGITFSLNRGLEFIHAHINCHYIARLDAGDTCSPERFHRQTASLNADPALVICGSWVKFYQPGTDFSYIYRATEKDSQIRKQMYFKCSFIHPSVMFRKSVLENCPLYPTDIPHAEDYAYFWQMLRYGTGTVLPEVLVNCIINPAGISRVNRKIQLSSREKTVGRFGTNLALKIAGKLKLGVLSLLPYGFVLILKKSK